MSGMTKTAFSSCFTGWIPRTENTEVMNVKDDAFAKNFGFELEDHRTRFALYTSSSPIIKVDVIEGKSRNLISVLSPHFFSIRQVIR